MLSWYFPATTTTAPAEAPRALALADNAVDAGAGSITLRQSTRSFTHHVVAAVFFSPARAAAWATAWASRLARPIAVTPADLPGAWQASVPCAPPAATIDNTIYTPTSWEAATDRPARAALTYTATHCEHCEHCIQPDWMTHCPQCGISLAGEMILLQDEARQLEDAYTAA